MLHYFQAFKLQAVYLCLTARLRYFDSWQLAWQDIGSTEYSLPR